MTSSRLNLEKAQRVRTSGFRTKVHELPDFKNWFDEEYKLGAKTIQSLRKEALQQFPRHRSQIPSVARLKSYVDKYLSETVKISPYAPNYVQQIGNFDAYLKMHELAKELWRRYEGAREREKIGNMKRDSLEWIVLYQKQLIAMIDAEFRLGIRPTDSPAPMFNQQNNIVQINTLATPNPALELDDEKVALWKAGIRKMRDDNR